MYKNQHVVPRGDRWAVIGEGNQRATRIVDSETEALEIAHVIRRNQGSDIVLHGRDDRVWDVDVFGHRFPRRSARSAQSA